MINETQKTKKNRRNKNDVAVPEQMIPFGVACSKFAQSYSFNWVFLILNLKFV